MAGRVEHCWTEKNEEGVSREVRATHFGGQWKIQAKTRGDETWTYYDQPLREDLESLLDILQRKYQRRRASHEDVKSVELLLKQS